MGKKLLKQITCSKEGCNANTILYYCPYCGDGHTVVFCEKHLREHLADYALEHFKLEK